MHYPRAQDWDGTAQGAILVSALDTSIYRIDDLTATAAASEATNKPSSTSPPAAPNSTFPPPKTDKPRPHVCTTCGRSFARLEHLKRHERSHTKEKPFECPACKRCFARRDLLLRHQQKLHSSTTPSSRPRNGRRESTTGVAHGRIRKPSVAGNTPAHMRPRANTLSHIDRSTLGVSVGGQFGRPFMPMHGHHNSYSGVPVSMGPMFRGVGSHPGMSTSALPRLDTSGLPPEFSGGLRTAPAHAGLGAEFDMGVFDYGVDDGNTINPYALHMHTNSATSLDSSWDSMQHMFSGMQPSQPIMEDEGVDWVMLGFENQMTFAGSNDNAIDDSSPSVMSTNSPAHLNDPNATSNLFSDSTNNGMIAMWHQQTPSQPMTHHSHMGSSPISMDVSPYYNDLRQTMSDTMLVKPVLNQHTSMLDVSLTTPPEMASIETFSFPAWSGGPFALPFQHDNLGSTASTASGDSSVRQSSVTTVSSELVNDHMRNVLLCSLNQQMAFGQRNQSQPAISSPLSPTGGHQAKVFSASNFPSTAELQRYVAAYIKYFHAHYPIIHLPTLSFETIDTQHSTTSTNNAAGGSCLILSVAAMGALHENDIATSRELFESAKRLISTYLEDRRKLNNGRSALPPHQRSDPEDTPLWLVQAMLLNVTYGINCGDKTAADIASNHCAALVSLARGAELAKPYTKSAASNHVGNGHVSSNGVADHVPSDLWASHGQQHNGNMDDPDRDWHEWKAAEERKRTLYAVFVLSSLLVTAYNRAPALTNSEIRLDLPCEEDLWAAESAAVWRARGGATAAETTSVQFAAALTHLLTAAQRERRAMAQQHPAQPWRDQPSELRPSSFGCLILINALHNYIWETRQRHLGREWTPPEIESMHSHIEPALRAWQAAWHSNPTHAVERPNPFGAGPLSADSIPLLDLAYVRLFVDFGRSKEAYWQRDYDAMAQELARGSGEATASGSVKVEGASVGLSRASSTMGAENGGTSPKHVSMEGVVLGAAHSQRERHLRKAAFYAADHLINSDRLGTSLGDNTQKELPIQAILCACDSAQVLAEWVATVQERVGRYLGVLGRDLIDYMQAPATLVLDDGDRKLLGMVEDFLASVEAKRDFGQHLIDARQGGYGSRILTITSETMAEAAVWPVTKLMASSLETQASHVRGRVKASVRVLDTFGYLFHHVSDKLS